MREVSRRRSRSGLARLRGGATSYQCRSRDFARRSIDSWAMARPSRHFPSAQDCAGISHAGALQLAEYLAAGRAALSYAYTKQHRLRTFLKRSWRDATRYSFPLRKSDQSGLGLALRKKFCRKFNFELQAAATEDNIVLSLTTAHSFELSEVSRYLHSKSARDVLIQALLDAPMFESRWRWLRPSHWPCRAFEAGERCPRNWLAWARRISSHQCSRIKLPVRRISPVSARFRIIRSSGKQLATA